MSSPAGGHLIWRFFQLGGDAASQDASVALFYDERMTGHRNVEDVAGVGAAIALATVLVLWLRGGVGGGSAAHCAGARDRDPADSPRKFIRLDVEAHLPTEGQTTPAEEAHGEDDRIWNPP
ncbi:unnamed protein product [Prorocentrum cordatum]|uniref:Subtilisin n=1 Tax=Prorocentrum cordatum TaxID=2364126 RepID=A0ABN9W7U7_9DINO|nr:unnamed protein product [Polarella glacialis]